jgi:hypothetical protein
MAEGKFITLSEETKKMNKIQTEKVSELDLG